MIRSRATCVALGIALLLLAACGDPASGPVEITWGRDVCSHCQMILSDRRFAAQLRSDRRVERFDDFGCALAWLGDHPDVQPREIFVMDEAHERWLDAKSARYATGRATPMGFGFGAHATTTDGDVDFEAARRLVEERERERARRADPR